MKLKNGEIFNAAQPLSKLMDEKFPVKVSLGLAKLVNKLNVELKAIEEVRQGLIKRYGKEEEGQLKVDPEDENYAPFIEALNELFDQEVEVVFDVVKLPEKVAATCDKCSHNMDKMLEIEPGILVALEKFVTID